MQLIVEFSRNRLTESNHHTHLNQGVERNLWNENDRFLSSIPNHLIELSFLGTLLAMHLETAIFSDYRHIIKLPQSRRRYVSQLLPPPCRVSTIGEIEICVCHHVTKRVITHSARTKQMITYSTPAQRLFVCLYCSSNQQTPVLFCS